MDTVWNKLLLVASIVVTLWPCLLCTSASYPDHVETTDNTEPVFPVQANCSDYPKCDLNMSIIHYAKKTGMNREACSHVYRSYYCQKSATLDCRKQGLITLNNLAIMKRAYIYAEMLTQEVCHSGSAPDSVVAKDGVHCTEYRSCFRGAVFQYKYAVKFSRFQEACSIASTIHMCATSTLSDCRRRGNLSSETLDFMKGMTDQAGVRAESSCARTTTTTTTPFHLPVTIRCEDYSDCPRPNLDVIHLAKRTKQFHQACLISKPYARCVEAAMADCQEKKMVSPKALRFMQTVVRQANSDVDSFCQFQDNAMMDERVPIPDLKATTATVAGNKQTPTPTSYAKMRCLDIGDCPRPPSLKALHEKGTQERTIACNTMRDHNRCITYATNDCEEKNIVNGPAFESMARAVNESKAIIERFCRQDSTGEADNDNNNSGLNTRPYHPAIAGFYVLLAVYRWI